MPTASDLKKWALGAVVVMDVLRRERASEFTKAEVIEKALSIAFKVAESGEGQSREEALAEIGRLLPKLEKLGGRVSKWKVRLEEARLAED